MMEERNQRHESDAEGNDFEPMDQKQSLLDEGVCSRHREGIIEVCVQPGCADLLCNKCKTTTHKDHHTMELSDYKDLCLTEFGNYQNCLQRYNTDLEKLLQKTDASFVPLKKIKAGGAKVECRPPMENSDEEDLRLQFVIKQNERVKEALDYIERATDPFLLDPLSSFQTIKEAYTKLDQVYKEDFFLPETVADAFTLSQPRVKISCGLSVSDDVKVLCLCNNGDLVVTGQDILEKKWRIRRFTRLGQIVWNKSPPLSWPLIDGMVDFPREDKTVLVSNGDEGEIVMVSNDDSVLCFSDRKSVPEAICLSPDSRTLFFKERYYNDKGGKIILLDTTANPFLPLKSLVPGFNFPFDMTYFAGGMDLLLITSHMKKVVKAIHVAEGKPAWTQGPVVLGEEIHPHGVCTSVHGDIFLADGENNRILKMNHEGDVVAVFHLRDFLLETYDESSCDIVLSAAVGNNHFAVMYDNQTSEETLLEWFDITHFTSELEKNRNVTACIFLTVCENGELIEGSFHRESSKFILRRITSSREPVLDYPLPDGWEKVDGMAEFTIDGKSNVLLSNQTQPYIMFIDGETGEIEGPVYQNDVQRATGMCIDKSTMDLYFIDVSTRPVNIQIVNMTHRQFAHKQTISTGLYGAQKLCFFPDKREVIVTSREESCVQRLSVETGKITWQKESDIEGVEIDPTAVTVNEDGIILVGDGCNHRVLLFQPGALEYFWFQKYKGDYGIVHDVTWHRGTITVAHVIPGEDQLEIDSLDIGKNVQISLRNIVCKMETEKGESADLMVEKLDEIGRALHGLELQMMIDVEHGDVDFSKILKITVDVLEKFKTDRNVQLEGCRVLGSLAEDAFSSNFNQGEMKHAVTVLLHCMENYVGDYELMEEGLECLASFNVENLVIIYEKTTDVLLKLLDDVLTVASEDREEIDIERRILNILQDLIDEDVNDDIKRGAASMGVNQIVLKAIRQHIDEDLCNKTFFHYWMFLITLTDESEENATKLVENGIIEIVMQCKKFEKEANLLDVIVHVLVNLSEHQVSRRRMMNIAFLSHLMEVPRTSKSASLDFKVVNVLVHLLWDGEEAWTVKAPSRESAVYLVTRKLHQWKIPTQLNIMYKNLLPITTLLTVQHTPCIVQWAVWVLLNLLTLDDRRYSALIKKGDTLSTLRGLLDDAETEKRTKSQLGKIIDIIKEIKQSETKSKNEGQGLRNLRK